MISFEDFKKVEIKVGKILSAEKIDGSEKLLKLMVDFGLKPSVKADDLPQLPEEREVRQIVSGIQKYFPTESELVGRKAMFVTNLEPRKLMGFESNGMLFAVGGGDKPFSLLYSDDIIEEGTPAN